MNRFRCQVRMCYPWRLDPNDPEIRGPEISIESVVRMNFRISMETKSSDRETFFKLELLLRC